MLSPLRLPLRSCSSKQGLLPVPPKQGAPSSDISRRHFAVHPVRELGDPVLRIPAAPVSPAEFGSPALRQLCDDLLDTMRAVNGAGIAAPQIGVSKRVFVVEGKGNNPRYPYKPAIPLTWFVNPEIVVLVPDATGSGSSSSSSGSPAEHPETIDLIEGCLSVPKFRGEVTRFARILIRAQNFETGSFFRLLCTGHAAGTMQHENDHLNATLFPDLAGPRGLMTSAVFEELHGGSETEFQRRMRAINERYTVPVKEVVE